MYARINVCMHVYVYVCMYVNIYYININLEQIDTCMYVRTNMRAFVITGNAECASRFEDASGVVESKFDGRTNFVGFHCYHLMHVCMYVIYDLYVCMYACVS